MSAPSTAGIHNKISRTVETFRRFVTHIERNEPTHAEQYARSLREMGYDVRLAEWFDEHMKTLRRPTQWGREFRP